MSRRSSLKGLEKINKNILEVGNRETTELFSWNQLLDDLVNKKIKLDNDYYENQVRKIYDDIFYNDPHHSDYIQGDFLDFDYNQFDPNDIELIMIRKEKDKNSNNWTEKYQNHKYQNTDNWYNINNLEDKYNKYFDQKIVANRDKIPIVIEISKDTNPDIKFHLFFRIIKDNQDFRQKRRNNYNYKFIIKELLDTRKDRYLWVKINDNKYNSVFEAIQRSKNKMNYVKNTLINEIREGKHNFNIQWYPYEGSYFENNNNPYLNFNYIDSGYYINMLLPDEKYSFKSCHITFHNQAGNINKIHFKFENDNKKVIYGTDLRIENYENDVTNYFKLEVISNEYFVNKKNLLHQKTVDFLIQIMELTQRTISLYIFDNLNDAEYLNFIISYNKFNQHLIHEYLRRKYTPIANSKEKGELYFYDFKIKKYQFKKKNVYIKVEFDIFFVNYNLLMIQIEINYDDNRVDKIRAIPYIDGSDNNNIKLFYVNNNIKRNNQYNYEIFLDKDYLYIEEFDFYFYLTSLINQNEFNRNIEIHKKFLLITDDNYVDIVINKKKNTYIRIFNNSSNQFEIYHNYINYFDMYYIIKDGKEDYELLKLDINLENFIKLDNYIKNKNFQNIFNNEKNKKIFKIESIYDSNYFKINGNLENFIKKLNDDDEFYTDNFNDMYQITNILLLNLYKILDENNIYKVSLNQKIFDKILNRHLLYIGNYNYDKEDMKIDNNDRDIKIDNDKLDKDIYDFLYSKDNDDRDIKIDNDDRDIYEYLSNNKNKILIFYGNNIDQNSNESKYFDLTPLLSKQIKDKIQPDSINNFKQEFIYEKEKISFEKFIFDENINDENNKNRNEAMRNSKEDYINLNFAESVVSREEVWHLKSIIIDGGYEQYYPDILYGEENDIEKNKYFLKKTILDHINQNIKEIKLRDGENTFLYKSKNSKSYIDEKDTIILFSVYYETFPKFLLHKFDLNTLGLDKNIKYIDNFNQFMVDYEGKKIHYIELSDKLNISLKYEIYLNYINKIKKDLKKQKKDSTGFNEINKLINDKYDILKNSRENDEYDIKLIIQNLSDKNEYLLLNEINNREFIINDLYNQLNAIKNYFLYNNNIFNNFLKDFVKFYKYIFENNDFGNNLIINKNIFDITNNFDIILFVKNSNLLGGSWRNKSTSSNNPNYPPNRYPNRSTRPNYARKNFNNSRSNINPNSTENYYKGYNRNIPFNNINQITIPYKNRNYYNLFTYIIEEEDKNFFNNEIVEIDSFRQLFYFKNEDKPKTFFDIFYKENQNFKEKMINKLKKLEEITDENTTFGELFILVDIGTYSYDKTKKINCDYCTALANINLNNFKKLYQKNINNDYFLNFLNYFLNKDNIKNLSYYLEDSTELYFEYLDYIKKIDISSNNFNSNEKKKEIIIFTKQWDQYFIHKININSNNISKIDNYNQIIELEDRNVSTEENISIKENSKKLKDFINENLLDLYIQDIIIDDTINDGIQYLKSLKQNNKIRENIQNLININNQERYTKFYTLNLRKKNNAIKNIYNKIKDKFNNIIFVEDKIDDQLDAIIYILIEKAKFYKFEINDDFKENLKMIIENFSEEDKNILIEALTYNKDDYEEYIKNKFQLEKTQQSDIKLQIGGEIEINSIINKINNDNYIDKLIKPEKLDQIINYQPDLDQKYFDKSKFNFNYLQKLNDEKERYKLEFANAIDQYKLKIITELNEIFLDNFESDPTLNLKDDLKNKINELKEKTENLKNNVNKDKFENFEEQLEKISSEIINFKENSYLISLAYRDFYFYFRYYILEKIISEKFMKEIPENINDELDKIFEYYNFKKEDDGVKAAKLAIIGDILDNILINKVKNVIFNEINLYISKENEFEIKKFKNTLSPDLIDIDNEFDVDLSKMNEKIKNILKYKNNIDNELVYNLGNVLIKNVKVQPILYYTNNFFDININKQQFIIYNKELKELLKDKIVLNYDLTKSLIDNQNEELLKALNEKIKLDKNKITKLIEYIQENKIDNNIYKYQDFCDNYNYHLKEELKKIQNHKNIFKNYDYLISVFIYFYKCTKKGETNLDDDTNDDLKESLDIEELKNYYDIKDIKKYSKTNIIKFINIKFTNNFNKIETKFNDKNLNNLEMMLVNPKDINNNKQLKKEFTSICLAIDLVVGNMYSKLLKRFLLEYFTDKYSSDVSEEQSLRRIKNIINNIMENIDNLINTKYDFKIGNFNDISIDNITEFTKKLVILHSEGRYQIKEYVELDEDNLFNEIVNLIKSNSYEKIEDDDIILTYLKDNINDYFKNFYKIAINTLIACSSGINNYILYHNKYKIILDFLNDILEKSNNKPTKAQKIEEDIKKRELLIDAIKNNKKNTLDKDFNENKSELDSFFDFTS